MKNILNIFSLPIIVCWLITFTAQAGSGNGSPNPTGGFGSTDMEHTTTQGSGNPMGNFGANEGFSIMAAPPGEPPSPDESMPIDGGASLLIGAGVALGSRKLYKSLKNRDKEPIS